VDGVQAGGGELGGGKASSVSLVSCRQSASTGLAASQSSTCGSRTFSEFTFQVAIFILEQPAVRERRW
jgi:hypothetical protein